MSGHKKSLQELTKEFREYVAYIKEHPITPEMIDTMTPTEQAWLKEQLELQKEQLMKLHKEIQRVLAKKKNQ